MARANPFDFVNSLKRLGIEMTAMDGSDTSLHTRPKRLVARVEKQGFCIETRGLNTRILQSYGFEPAVVFDIGVDQGTPELYNAFRDKKFVLVDPVAESEEKVQPWKDRIDFDFHCCAVGAKSGTVTLNVPSTETKARHSRASVMEFQDGYEAEFATIEKRKVPQKALDTISKAYKGPFGLKIDTEGYELEVLKGATKTLKSTEFVLAEASVKMRFRDSYKFSDLVAFMGAQGFEILEFLRPIRRDAADCDVLFARFDSGRFDLGS